MEGIIIKVLESITGEQDSEAMNRFLCVGQKLSGAACTVLYIV